MYVKKQIYRRIVKIPKPQTLLRVWGLGLKVVIGINRRYFGESKTSPFYNRKGGIPFLNYKLLIKREYSLSFF